MMNRAKIADLIKNAVIVVLAISAVLLFVTVTGDILYFSPEETAATAASGVEGIMTSVPHTIAVTIPSSDSGKKSQAEHFAAKYSSADKSRLFSQFSISLGEALGSSFEPESIKEADWRAALSYPGVFFDYLYAQPLNLIAARHGTEISESYSGVTVRRLCLAVHSDTVWLYYIDDMTGNFRRMSTALSSEAFSSRLTVTDLSAARFAFEDSGDVLSEIDPYFIYSGEGITLSDVQSAAPVVTLESGLAKAETFSMNERSTTQYVEDGDTVYVEGYKKLRLSPSGSVIFSASNSEGIPVNYSGASPTLYECVLSASAIVNQTIEGYRGDAEIGITEINFEPNGNAVIAFGYYVNSTPLRFPGRDWCARIEISGGQIIRAELIYRTYTLQLSSFSPFPEDQNAIISANNGGAPLLMYEDSLGALGTNWYTIM